MIQRDVKITNNSGLHARPATFFIQKANTYRSGIWVVKDDRKVSAKSLLGVLSIGIAKGMTITLVADGDDEQNAIDGLVELIETGFND
jgi:phosphocarrier protein